MSTADPGHPRPAADFPDDLIATQQSWIRAYNQLARRPATGRPELRAELFRPLLPNRLPSPLG